MNSSETRYEILATITVFNIEYRCCYLQDAIINQYSVIID